MKTTTITCDLCGGKFNVENKSMQIIFTTNQTDGVGSENHFCTDSIDICKNCLGRALEGNYIFASGAQGYNKYWFKDSFFAPIKVGEK